MPTLTDLALQYRAKGWHPIPLCRPKEGGGCWHHTACQGPGKRPLVDDWPSLHHTSEAEIRTWERRFAAYNIGLLMGHGTFAVDVDPRNGGDITFEQLDVPASLRVLTPSDGWHVYLAGSPPKGVLGPGVDLIGVGGQVVAPPSIHVQTLTSGVPYVWEDCDEDVPDPPTVEWAPPTTDKRTHAPSTVAALPASEARRIGEALFRIPPEERRLWLKVGMALKTALGEGGYALFDSWSRTTTAGNYDAAENRKQWDSLKPGDGTEGTVNEETLFWLSQGYAIEDDAPAPAPTAEALPFPLACIDTMPPLMRTAYDWILARSIRPQPVLAFAGTLALFSALTARRYGLDRARTNLYILGIAPTGSGKNDPRSAIKDLLIAADLSKHLGGEDLASDSGILSALDREPATLFQLDEFGEMVGRWTGPNAKPHEKAIKTILLSMFSANGGRVLGKEYSQAGKKKQDQVERIDLKDPCMVVHGTTTPDMWEYLEGRDAARGFLSRMLVFESALTCPALNAVGDTAPPDDLMLGIKELRASSGNLQDVLGSTECRIIPQLKGYRAALEALDEEVRREGAACYYTGPWDAINRRVELAQRLAIIRAAASDPVNPVMRAEDLDWAAPIVRYSNALVCRRLETSVSDSRTGKAANQLLAYIERRGEASQRDITRAFQHLPRRDREERLTDLVEAGRVRKTTRPTGGRPATVYVIA